MFRNIVNSDRKRGKQTKATLIKKRAKQTEALPRKLIGSFLGPLGSIGPPKARRKLAIELAKELNDDPSLDRQAKLQEAIEQLRNG